MSITVGENSYIDTEEANEYFAGRLHAESWGETSDADKEKALRQATKEIDRQLLKGRKATNTQELAFPRYVVHAGQHERDLCAGGGRGLLSQEAKELLRPWLLGSVNII